MDTEEGISNEKSIESNVRELSLKEKRYYEEYKAKQNEANNIQQTIEKMKEQAEEHNQTIISKKTKLQAELKVTKNELRHLETKFKEVSDCSPLTKDAVQSLLDKLNDIAQVRNEDISTIESKIASKILQAKSERHLANAKAKISVIDTCMKLRDSLDDKIAKQKQDVSKELELCIKIFEQLDLKISQEFMYNPELNIKDLGEKSRKLTKTIEQICSKNGLERGASFRIQLERINNSISRLNTDLKKTINQSNKSKKEKLTEEINKLKNTKGALEECVERKQEIRKIKNIRKLIGDKELMQRIVYKLNEDKTISKNEFKNMMEDEQRDVIALNMYKNSTKCEVNEIQDLVQQLDKRKDEIGAKEKKIEEYGNSIEDLKVRKQDLEKELDKTVEESSECEKRHDKETVTELLRKSKLEEESRIALKNYEMAHSKKKKLNENLKEHKINVQTTREMKKQLECIEKDIGEQEQEKAKKKKEFQDKINKLLVEQEKIEEKLSSIYVGMPILLLKRKSSEKEDRINEVKRKIRNPQKSIYIYNKDEK